MESNTTIIAWELTQVNNPEILAHQYDKDYRTFKLNLVCGFVLAKLNSEYVYYAIISDHVEKIVSEYDIELNTFVKMYKGKTITEMKYDGHAWRYQDFMTKVQMCETCYWYFYKNNLSLCMRCQAMTCEDCSTHYCASLAREY